MWCGQVPEGASERRAAYESARQHYSLDTPQARNELPDLGGRRLSSEVAKMVLPTNAQGREVSVHYSVRRYAARQLCPDRAEHCDTLPCESCGWQAPAPNLLMLSRLCAELIFLEGHGTTADDMARWYVQEVSEPSNPLVS